ncbi:PP2C family protein-serine/threonine phosphatase [Ilumatobacter coccineus]|jgi:phosphoserine phosphatase RsbU/P|uniref:Putative serine/threonine protein phosphatase n=1 Tax=Ilumatobacter coccineus (strain NBRC 103263 / KCTC 29153 / YM16-304) TaxID=1313172 RepID=A0A6C7E2V5_ILUCY|nr:SpoIIE family protein phosphatase [Ilumatobacter coccineus]BAN01120.1 putative serine/threonine protein phosphatase [Ilumatobacter coccineus YM16-304]
MTNSLAPRLDAPVLADHFSPEGVERLVRAVSLSLRDGVVVQRGSGEFVWFNAVACRLLRMTPEELQSRPSKSEFWQAVHPDGSPYPGDEHPGPLAIRTGTPVRGALMCLRTGDYDTRWVSADATPITIDGERLAVVIFTDITDERADREALVSAMAELQQLLLQENFPKNDIVNFAARYRSVGMSTSLGGDFYGAYQHSPRRLGFFMGDVCGHGIGSASLSSVARNTMRAISPVVDNPSLILSELHRLVLDERPDTFLTGLAGYVEQTPSRVQLRLAIGGHPSPILVRDGRATYIGHAGPLVGMVPDAPRPLFECELLPGDRVIAYTDGVLDSATPRLDGDELLAAVPAHGDIDDTLDALMRLADADLIAADDTALLGFEVL